MLPTRKHLSWEKSCSAKEAGLAVGTVPSALGNRLWERTKEWAEK